MVKTIIGFILITAGLWLLGLTFATVNNSVEDIISPVLLVIPLLGIILIGVGIALIVSGLRRNR